MKRTNTALLVLGDIGHSPRMQNNALQISRHTDSHVFLVGYLQSTPKEAILSSPDVTIVDIALPLLKTLRRMPRILFPLYALLRIVLEFVYLLYTFLFRLPRCQYFLLQNPPTLPALPVLAAVALLKGTRLIIDFHNYGYSLLQVGRRPKPLVALARWLERFFARKSWASFCVSEAMRQDLQNWGLRPSLLRDRPDPSVFKDYSQSQRNYVLKKYSVKVPEDGLLVVSSTSWTPDQDFGVLLDALQDYEQKATQSTRPICCIITGKGPQKEHYMRIVGELAPSWRKISVSALWLNIEDYPVLLSCADVGVCLHYSSSGLDLPMKVVDMFGAGVPVLAIHYPTICELVQHERNGLIFKSSVELCLQLLLVAEKPDLLEQCRRGAREWRTITYHQEWQPYLPLFK